MAYSLVVSCRFSLLLHALHPLFLVSDAHYLSASALASGSSCVVGLLPTALASGQACKTRDAPCLLEQTLAVPRCSLRRVGILRRGWCGWHPCRGLGRAPAGGRAARGARRGLARLEAAGAFDLDSPAARDGASRPGGRVEIFIGPFDRGWELRLLAPMAVVTVAVTVAIAVSVPVSVPISISIAITVSVSVAVSPALVLVFFPLSAVVSIPIPIAIPVPVPVSVSLAVVVFGSVAAVAGLVSTIVLGLPISVSSFVSFPVLAAASVASSPGALGRSRSRP